MVFLSAKVEGTAAVQKRMRRIRSAAVEREVARRVMDDAMMIMEQNAPRGTSSRRAIDLRPRLKRFSRVNRNKVIEGIRIDTPEARAKAYAVSFGTRRHRAIERFIQAGRKARRVFFKFKREFRKQLRKAAR